MSRLFVTGAIVAYLFSVAAAQSIENIANNLGIRVEVVSNLVGGSDNCTRKLTLSNKGQQDIEGTQWRLYFMSVYMIEPDKELWKHDDGYEIPNSGFKVYHIAGSLFMFEPTSSFAGIRAGGSIVINFISQYWTVARTDNMPNWYVTNSTGKGNVTVVSTATENLARFTGNYNTEAQWKRNDADTYNPWSPEERWIMNDIQDQEASSKMVIPTLMKVTTEEKDPIMKPLTGWTVKAVDGLENEADILNARVGESVSGKGEINLDINDLAFSHNSEGYKIVLDGSSKRISISSPSPAGVFYGCQTLLSILDSEGSEIESMTIEDAPRYGHRGMYVDAARHFVPKDDLKKLIKAMGMYKLNKFHLHLSDDEGWRIHMPWCPYLTTTGATQCHDESEMSCQYPQFGSAPDGGDRGSGSYSLDDYREILETAQKNHVEVIPEIDMPGHARAAIKGTQAFLKSQPDNEEARAIQLMHENDTSQYLSVQLYTDNAIDPCLNSTYEFINKTISTFIEYHADIQPLKVMHIGGDEVAEGAWLNSPACTQQASHQGEVNTTRLSEEFVFRVSQIAQDLKSDLVLGLWEDGAISNGKPFDRSDIKTDEVLVNSWQNPWEWDTASRAYKLANAGFKVVMSQATHLYFDHPPEPDPEERGFYWATRYSNIRKTFGFKPDDLYANIDVDRFGNPLNKDTLCQTIDCEELQSDKRDNIIGMQGHIWTETMRTSQQLFDAVFPRFLALAERAWHKAEWETSLDEAKEKQDWTNFANTLGYKELQRLDDMNISYRVPVPGVKSTNQGLIANVQLPGLGLSYSTQDKPKEWKKYVEPVSTKGVFHFRAHSADNLRTSRVVSATYSSSAKIELHFVTAMFSFVAVFFSLKL